MWVETPSFLDIVRKQWQKCISGCTTFGIVQKLKMLKQDFKKLNNEGFSDIQAVSLKAYHDLLGLQEKLQNNPHDADIASQKKQAGIAYRKAHQNYVSFLQQKAKVEWLIEGDDNTHLFHQSLRMRRVQNRINSIHNLNGVWKTEPKDVNAAFLDYYMQLLGTEMTDRKNVHSSVVANGQDLDRGSKGSIESRLYRC